jgi:hypothetical protein
VVGTVVVEVVVVEVVVVGVVVVGVVVVVVVEVGSVVVGTVVVEPLVVVAEVTDFADLPYFAVSSIAKVLEFAPAAAASVNAAVVSAAPPHPTLISANATDVVRRLIRKAGLFWLMSYSLIQ